MGIVHSRLCSHFAGLVDWTVREGVFLFEAEVQLVIIEPRNSGIDSLILEFLREMGVVFGKDIGIGSVVVGNDDRIIMEANISTNDACIVHRGGREVH